MPPMLEQSKLCIELLAGGVEIAAAVIIGLAAAEAVWKALPLFLRRGLPQDIKVEVRLSLGRWLALGDLLDCRGLLQLSCEATIGENPKKQFECHQQSFGK